MPGDRRLWHLKGLYQFANRLLPLLQFIQNEEPVGVRERLAQLCLQSIDSQIMSITLFSQVVHLFPLFVYMHSDMLPQQTHYVNSLAFLQPLMFPITLQ